MFAQSSNGQSALASPAEGTSFEQSMRTKYIAQTVTPKWNEEMVILVSYPFVNDPKVGCPRRQTSTQPHRWRPLVFI
jgi:hypothetical protein